MSQSSKWLTDTLMQESLWLRYSISVAVLSVSGLMRHLAAGQGTSRSGGAMSQSSKWLPQHPDASNIVPKRQHFCCRVGCLRVCVSSHKCQEYLDS